MLVSRVLVHYLWLGSVYFADSGKSSAGCILLFKPLQTVSTFVQI